MKIAIIDGIINSHFFDKKVEVTRVHINELGEIEEYENKISNDYTHATAVSEIIINNTSNYSLICIAITDHCGKAYVSQLISALEWCDKNGVEIINLSIGTENICEYQGIKRVITRLIWKDCVIVAAKSNSKGYTLPADIMGVFSISLGENLNELKSVGNNSYLEPDIKGSNIRQYNGKIDIVKQNSYAAPFLTSIINSHLNLNGNIGFNINNICELFNLNGKYFCESYFKPDYLNSVCIYNLISEEDIFSESIQIIKTNFDLNEKLCGYEDVLVLPSKETNIENFIYDNYRMIRSFCYAGILEQNIIDFLNRKNIYLIWDETLCWKEDYDLAGYQIPIVYVVATDERANFFIKKLETEFNLLGYRCQSFSENERSYLHSIDYIPGKINDKKNVVLGRSKYYELDVAIFNTYSHNVCDDFLIILDYKHDRNNFDKNIIYVDLEQEIDYSSIIFMILEYYS